MALSSGSGSRTSAAGDGWPARMARWRARLFYGPLGLAWLRAAGLGQGDDAGRLQAWARATVPTFPLLARLASFVRGFRDAVRGRPPATAPAPPPLEWASVKAAAANISAAPDCDPMIVEFVAVTTIEEALFAIEMWDIVSAQLPEVRARLPKDGAAPARALRLMLADAAVEAAAGVRVEFCSPPGAASEPIQLAPSAAAARVLALTGRA